MKGEKANQTLEFEVKEKHTTTIHFLERSDIDLAIFLKNSKKANPAICKLGKETLTSQTQKSFHFQKFWKFPTLLLILTNKEESLKQNPPLEGQLSSKSYLKFWEKRTFLK